MPKGPTPRRDYSLASRPLEWIARTVVRFPVSTLIVAGLAAAASIWLATTQLGFRTSRAELLSPDSEYNRRWIAYTDEFGDKEDVVVVVEGTDRERTVSALDDMCRELAERGERFAAVMHKIDLAALRAKGLYYLDLDELRQIDRLLELAVPALRGDAARSDLAAVAAISDSLSEIERSLADRSPDGFFFARPRSPDFRRRPNGLYPAQTDRTRHAKLRPKQRLD